MNLGGKVHGVIYIRKTPRGCDGGHEPGIFRHQRKVLDNVGEYAYF